jgi:hypothetical protein
MIVAAGDRSGKEINAGELLDLQLLRREAETALKP